MNTQAALTLLEGLFASSEQVGLNSLTETQVYDFFDVAGFDVPEYHIIDKELKGSFDFLHQLPGDRVVVKVLSPFISHKTELQGVLDVEKKPQVVRGVALEMLHNLPKRYADFLQQRPSLFPARYKGLSGDDLIKAIYDDIKGILVAQYIEHSQGFDSELFVGLRWTREFGPVISAGIGGVDTELFAKKFCPEEAVITASTRMVSPEEFFEKFKKTTCYSIISGRVRGHKRLVEDEELLKIFKLFFMVARRFSEDNLNTRYSIEEFEVNPFALTGGKAIAVDGLLRFSTNKIIRKNRPLDKIRSLLHPESVAVVGVSAKEINVGRQILRNLKASNFDLEKIRVIKKGVDSIEGIKCVPSVKELEGVVDLVILAVKASGVVDVLKEFVRYKKARSVIVIPGGMGEKSEGKAIEEELINVIQQARKDDPDNAPVVLGGNCLGIVSKPGNIDTLFIPDIKLPKQSGVKKNIAFVSQSGAYMITRMNRLEYIETVYDISTGNQVDITVSDLMKVVGEEERVSVVAVYLEGFKDLDGMEVAQVTRELRAKGKQVVVYKAGRTEEGKTATSGHTASIAGDYHVAVTILEHAGAFVADTFTQFLDYLMAASLLDDKEASGLRLGAVSNAGYETVAMADSVQGHGYRLKLAEFSEGTKEELKKLIQRHELTELVSIRNPLDLTPMANDDAYEGAVRAMLNDPRVDFVIVGLVPFTPALKTLPRGVDPVDSVEAEDSIARRLVRLSKEYKKPIVAVVDAGKLYDPLANGLKRNGILVFRSADRAVWTMGMYLSNRLRKF